MSCGKLPVGGKKWAEKDHLNPPINPAESSISTDRIASRRKWPLLRQREINEQGNDASSHREHPENLPAGAKDGAAHAVVGTGMIGTSGGVHENVGICARFTQHATISRGFFRNFFQAQSWRPPDPAVFLYRKTRSRIYTLNAEGRLSGFPAASVRVPRNNP